MLVPLPVKLGANIAQSLHLLLPGLVSGPVVGDVDAPEVLHEGDLGQGILLLETVNDSPDEGTLGDRGIPCGIKHFTAIICYGEILVGYLLPLVLQLNFVQWFVLASVHLAAKPGELNRVEENLYLGLVAIVLFPSSLSSVC